MIWSRSHGLLGVHLIQLPTTTTSVEWLLTCQTNSGYDISLKWTTSRGVTRPANIMAKWFSMPGRIEAFVSTKYPGHRLIATGLPAPTSRSMARLTALIVGSCQLTTSALLTIPGTSPLTVDRY